MTCPVCGSGDVVSWRDGIDPARLRPEDVRVTDSGYGTTLPLLRCRGCTHRFADVHDATLTRLYADLDDPAYDAGSPARTLQMQWLLDAALQARPGARTLLDVGAASGLLVAEAARRGLDAVGVEPSGALVRAARARGANVVEGVLPHAQVTGTFDLVTLIDVLEHVAAPRDLLRTARAHLAPAGRALVVTPDAGSLAARVLGRRWWHYRLAHVGYFDARTFGVLAERTGLGVVDRFRARWFFPADYLAERLGRYVPGAGWLARGPWRDRVVPLDLRDSWVFVVEPR